MEEEGFDNYARARKPRTHADGADGEREQK